MNSYQEIAAAIVELRRQAGARGGLAHSSLEDGSINEYDRGQLTSTIGRQFDGTHGVVVVSGPIPPTPTMPTAYGVIGGVAVDWDGLWELAAADAGFGDFVERPTVAPGDFSRVEAQICTDPAFPVGAAIQYRSIESPRGGGVIFPLPVGPNVYARLVARTLPGKTSLPSVVAGPISALQVTADDLDVDLSELGGNHVFYGPDEPEAIVDGDLWLKTPENVVYGWSDAAGVWTVYRDQGIAEALQAAEDATTAAQAATDAAAGASTLAGQAKTAADSKVTIYRQATAPTGGTYKVNGDLWIDSDDGIVYYASTTAGGWLATPDQRIATALTNAGAAQTTAASKTTVFAQTSAPATTGRTVGDLWIDTDDSNTIYDWPTAGGWTKRALGATALNVTARQIGGITTYFQTTQPASGMLAGDLWIDTDDNNRTYRYGTSWTVAEDQRIGTALSTATTANTAVATKITTFAQTSPPSTTGRTAGDVWIDTDAGNTIYTWTGAWTIRPLGGGALNLTVPFDKVEGDGRDSISLGADLPPELKGYLDTALFFRAGSYTAAGTYMKVKYFGMGSKGTLFFQFVYVENYKNVAGNHQLINLSSFLFDDDYTLLTQIGPISNSGVDVSSLVWISDNQFLMAQGEFGNRHVVWTDRNYFRDWDDPGGNVVYTPEYEPVSARLLPTGTVRVTGLVKVVQPIQRNLGRIMFTLDPNFRPQYHLLRWCKVSQSSGYGAKEVRIDVYPDGNVQLNTGSDSVHAGAYLQLDLEFDQKGVPR